MMYSMVIIKGRELSRKIHRQSMHVGDIIPKGAGTSLWMPVWFSDRAKSKDALGKCRDSLWPVFVSHF